MTSPNDKYEYSEGEENEFFPDPEELFEDDEDVIYEDAPSDFEDITDSLSDIDFSEIRGDFRSGMKQINKKIKKQKKVKRKKSLSQKIPVEKRATIYGHQKKLAKVIVPRDRKVIVEGVSKFILSDRPEDNASKNIGYYKGRKLKELVLTMNNNSALNFNMELFNPSMPLDYLYSTSLNLNDKIQVAGGQVSYSDVLFNLLANPALIVNAKLVIAGPSLVSQINQALIFKNKSIEGKQKVAPFQPNLNIDTMQVQNDIVYFDIMGGLNRPFIPDGMDVVQYTVLPGNTVTFAFYYKQISLKKLLIKEARQSKRLM